MRISDWSSDVCSSDLLGCFAGAGPDIRRRTGDNLVEIDRTRGTLGQVGRRHSLHILRAPDPNRRGILPEGIAPILDLLHEGDRFVLRSEEHTSELQSLMRISYAVFCLKKTKKQTSLSTILPNSKNLNI